MSLAVFCFPCCVDEQPPPRRRPKIDRSQIGLPTNFQHTGHIGSGEVASGFDVHQVQNSMQSKGGYEATMTSQNDNNDDNGIRTQDNNSSSYNTRSPEEVRLTINTEEDTTNEQMHNS